MASQVKNHSVNAATTNPYFRDPKCKKRKILFASCELLKMSRRTLHASFCSLLTFELTHLSIVELKSTALNHSAKLASSDHKISYAIIFDYLTLCRDVFMIALSTWQLSASEGYKPAPRTRCLYCACL